MNDKFTNMNPEDSEFADKLNTLSEQIHPDPRFANELERKLKATHKPKTIWLKAPMNSILPSLGWVALVVVTGLALIWTIQNLVPKPQPGSDQKPSVGETSTPSSDATIQDATPDPNRPGYDFRGAKLTLSVALPESPAQANVYMLNVSQPARAEYARSLADQFGIQGDIYTVERQYPPQPGFMITDGKQRLEVYSLNNYSYTSDMVTSSHYYNGFPSDNAEAIISEYISSHGLDFPYRLEESDLFGGYTLQQISPDGLPIQFESLGQPSMRITLDENGNVLTVMATMMNYEPAPVGSYGIISADEALQMVLDDTLPAGKIESSAGGDTSGEFIPPQSWYRDYPNDQTVTIFGNVSSSKSVDPGKPAIVFIDAVSATGNTAGMEALDFYTFVTATGQYVMDGDVRKFNVETWNAEGMSSYLSGTVRREGEQFIFTETGSDAQYSIIDSPADLPLDIDPKKSLISFDGMIVDGKLDWRSITYYPDINQMGGGGGGGGYGFYNLNLSGTPIPFPTATPMGQGYTQAEIAGFLIYSVQDGDTLLQIAATYNVSVDEIVQINYLTDTTIYVGQQLVIPGVAGATRLDGEPGTLMVNIYAKPDGRQRIVYAFASQKDQTYYQLTGDNLEPLQQLHGHPISIWGSISYDQYGAPFLAVEKYEELYPGLQFQLVTGPQEMKDVNGESLVLISSNGITYVQMGNTGGYPDGNYNPRDPNALIEGIIVPGETYAGYPTIRVFSIGPAIDSTTGEPFEFPNSAATPEVLPDPFGNSDQYTYPDVVVETVELVYYATNTETNDYIQPAWHFQGHFSNGTVFDVLIQALRKEYLSPEIDQNIPPG